MPRKPRFRSKNEKVAYEVLQAMFPNTVIIHDYPLGGGLKIDFLVKSTVVFAVEVNGEQHYAFNSRWHRDLNDFKLQVRRDKKKRALCKAQKIPLLEYDARHGLSPASFGGKVERFVLDMEVPERETPVEKPEVSEWKTKMKERQREYRKQSYKNWKLKKKQYKADRDL